MEDQGLLDYIRTNQVAEVLSQRVQLGWPELSWDGDPWLVVVHNKLEDLIEVWDTKHERPVLYAQKRLSSFGGRIEPAVARLCMHLRDHDFRKYTMEQQIQRVDDANERRQQELDYEHHQKMMASMEKVYWGLAKDLGESRPFISVPS